MFPLWMFLAKSGFVFYVRAEASCLAHGYTRQSDHVIITSQFPVHFQFRFSYFKKFICIQISFKLTKFTDITIITSLDDKITIKLLARQKFV